MGVSRTRLGGRVSRGTVRGSASFGTLALLFLVGATGTRAQTPSFPTDATFCAAWVNYATCNGDGANADATMCDATKCLSNGMTQQDHACGFLNTNTYETDWDGVTQGWFDDVEIMCDSNAGCDGNDGCMTVHNGTDNECKPMPYKSEQWLVGNNASDAVIAYDQSVRHKYYCKTVNDMTDCATRPGCEVNVNNNQCQYVSEYGTYDVVSTCGVSSIADGDKDLLAIAAFQTDWDDLSSNVTGRFPNYAVGDGSGSSSGSYPTWPTPTEYCAAWEVDAHCGQSGYDQPSCDADSRCGYRNDKCRSSNATGAGDFASYAEVWSYNEIVESESFKNEYGLSAQFDNCQAHNSNETGCNADSRCGYNYKLALYGTYSCGISHEVIAQLAIDHDGAPWPYAKLVELEAYGDQVCFNNNNVSNETACVADARCGWQELNPTGCAASPDAYTVAAVNACVDYDPTGLFWVAMTEMPAFAHLPGGIDGAFARLKTERVSKYPGQVGCQLDCESARYDIAGCDAKPYYCRWSTDRQRCVSAVGPEACPNATPTARWLPVAYSSAAASAARFNDAFRESANKIIRVDWRGLDFAYVRVVDFETFDAHQRLFVDWNSTGTEMYGTYHDALARSRDKKWSHCGGGAGGGFPGDCAPSNDSDDVSYYANKLLSTAASHHAVYLESPKPVPFGTRFSPPLDSNRAVFDGSREMSSVGDLSLGGANAFTIRFRSDLTPPAVGTRYGSILSMPGIVDIKTFASNVAVHWEITIGNCGVMFVSHGGAVGPEETVVTYNGSHVSMYRHGSLVSGIYYGNSVGTAEAPCALPLLPHAVWKMGDLTSYPIFGSVSYLTVWAGVALSSENVGRLAMADFRYVPKPTHHFNFDEGSGSVVRDSIPGAGVFATKRAHFGPVPMYGKYPVAPSLTAYLTAQNANAYSMVHVDDSHTLAKMYEGSFTVQVWYRADGAFMAELAGAGLPYVFTNHNWSLNLVQSLSASKFGLRLVYNASDQSSSVSVDDALDANTWTHLAVQRDNENGVWRLFVNGVARVSSSEVDYPYQNGYGGVGVDSGSVTPTSIMGLGFYLTCAVRSDGAVVFWGSGGSSGDGTNAARSSPTAVVGITAGTVTTLDAGNQHTIALRRDGSVVCWGENNFGQLGDGTTTNRNAPVPVDGLTAGVVSSVAAASIGGCAALQAGGVRCWGYNGDGQVGDGTVGTNRLAPVNVTGITGTVTKLFGGWYPGTFCAVLESGVVMCWGKNDYGQCGDSTAADRSAPVTNAVVAGTTNVLALGQSHGCVLLEGGSVKCWGKGSNGQLGHGSNPGVSYTGVVVSGITTAVSLDAGENFSCASLTDGSVKCWGLNSNGQLGDGTGTGSRNEPVNVTGISSATNVACGARHACAALIDGSMVCWGNNDDGRLGDGTTAWRTTPVVVRETVEVGNPALALLQVVTNGLTIGPGGASTVSFSDFQVYSAAVAPHFPTGKGVCAPPKSEFLLIWLPLDRVGEQVDASGFGHAASATGSWVATAVTAAVIDPHARTSPPAIPSDAPCGAWANYDGCDAPEPAECSACLSSAGFDTGECGLKAVGGVVRFVDGFTTHTFTMNETFTVLRADLRKVEVLVVGAGGGAGAVGTGLGNAATGANGGGGGFVTITTVDVSKGATFQITVGAGGTGSSAVSTGGADGGQSEFGAIANAMSVVTALGGGGGASNVEKSSVQGGWGESNAGAAGAASHGNYDATGVLGYGNWRDFAGDAIIASTSGAPTAYAGGGGCCVRDPDPQKGNGCSAGSETGGDAKPVCLFGKCDGHQNSGGGGGVALVGQSGDGADGVVVVRYQ